MIMSEVPLQGRTGSGSRIRRGSALTAAISRPTSPRGSADRNASLAPPPHPSLFFFITLGLELPPILQKVTCGKELGRGIQGYLEKGIQTPMAQGRSTMIKRIRTSRLSMKKALSVGCTAARHRPRPPPPPPLRPRAPRGTPHSSRPTIVPRGGAA